MSTITPAAVTPVTGAAATTPSYSGTFIPSLWSGKLIAKFYATTMFGEICNTDYQGEISNLGDKIIINSIPDVAIADYLVGGTLSYGVPTPVANVELQINKAKAFTFNLPDVLEYQARPKLLDVFSGEASAKMKIYIDDDLLFNSYSTGAAANKGATAGVRSAAYNLGIDTAPVALTASNVLTVLTQLAGVLDEQNVPDADRYLIIDPLTRNILMQSNLAQAQFTGDAASLVRTGKIGRIDRFDVYVSNLLPRGAAGKAWVSGNTDPSTGGTTASVLGRRALIAGHKTALTFASQIVKTETIRNPNDFGDLVRGLQVYGYKTLKPESLALAVVA